MRTFVAGGTGVLGRRVLLRLVADGHVVTAVARSPEKAAVVRAVGAEPVTVDLFDGPTLRSVVSGQDAVINLATDVPAPARAPFPSAWLAGSRLRSEGSAVLARAALDAGVPRLVQESIAFLYPDRGDAWIDEDVPLDPPELGRPSVAAEDSAARFSAAGGTGVVLRFGQIYAPESLHTRYQRTMIRRRLPALPGASSAYAPAISADDAAAAVVAALSVDGGTWNVTDDRPLTRQEFHAALADLLGVKPPLLSDATILGLHPYAEFFLRSQRVANHRFAAATGWSPRHPDAAAGWRAMIADLPR